MARYRRVQLRINADRFPDVVAWIDDQARGKLTQAICDLVQAHIAPATGLSTLADLDARLDFQAEQLARIERALAQGVTLTEAPTGQAGDRLDSADPLRAKLDAL